MKTLHKLFLPWVITPLVAALVFVVLVVGFLKARNKVTLLTDEVVVLTEKLSSTQEDFKKVVQYNTALGDTLELMVTNIKSITTNLDNAQKASADLDHKYGLAVEELDTKVIEVEILLGNIDTLEENYANEIEQTSQLNSTLEFAEIENANLRRERESVEESFQRSIENINSLRDQMAQMDRQLDWEMNPSWHRQFLEWTPAALVGLILGKAIF